MAETDFAQERRFFDRNIATWLNQESNVGKWVLIKGDKLIDMCDEFDQAVQAGFAQFGLEPFLVSRIEKGAHEITTTAFMIDEILTGHQDVKRTRNLR